MILYITKPNPTIYPTKGFSGVNVFKTLPIFIDGKWEGEAYGKGKDLRELIVPQDYSKLSRMVLSTFNGFSCIRKLNYIVTDMLDEGKSINDISDEVEILGKEWDVWIKEINIENKRLV